MIRSSYLEMACCTPDYFPAYVVADMMGFKFTAAIIAKGLSIAGSINNLLLCITVAARSMFRI
jgi:hypothetical protein